MMLEQNLETKSLRGFLSDSAYYQAKVEQLRIDKNKSQFNQSKWRSIARPEQIAPPGDWTVWLILAGRGFGKTRTGAEWLREQARRVPFLRIIAPTFADARDVCVEGESGLKSICASNELVRWNRSIGEGEFYSGARFKVFSGEEPDRLRGPQSYADWYDELAAWQRARATWDMAMLGLRLGEKPRVCVTTTPRPLELLRELIASSSTHVTRGSTYDNRANLAPSYFEQIISRYEGTRLGRQELNAEILDDVPGALWTRNLIEQTRVSASALRTLNLKRIVVAIDPAATSNTDSDETGIVVCGIADVMAENKKQTHGYLLHDASGRYSPDGWARKALDLYREWNADRIVYEMNQGGEMVEYTLRTIQSNAPLRGVHASKSKQARAEPISAFYEQARVHHVGATFAELEDQLTSWVPGAASPDRLDALVWAFTELMLDNARTWVRGAAQ